VSGWGGAREGAGRKPKYAKACSRCGVVKPASSFGRNRRMADGLSCDCRDCHAESNAAFRRNNPGLGLAARQLKRQPEYADPVAYSLGVCEHVATYVGRAIAGFERRTGKEAPPHLAAILAMARQLAEEQAPHVGPRRGGGTLRVCRGCGAAFTAYRRDSWMCSDACRYHATYLADKASGKKAEERRLYIARRNEREPGWQKRAAERRAGR
jgi:hypothetical protein